MSRGRRNSRPEVIPPIDRRDCLREFLRPAGEPPTSVRVYLTCGLKIPVSVVRFRPLGTMNSARFLSTGRLLAVDRIGALGQQWRRDGGDRRPHCPRVGAAHRIRPPRRHICLRCRPPAARQRRGVDEAFLVVTLAPLEVVDLSMASPAPVEAPVQRGGFR